MVLPRSGPPGGRTGDREGRTRSFTHVFRDPGPRRASEWKAAEGGEGALRSGRDPERESATPLPSGPWNDPVRRRPDAPLSSLYVIPFTSFTRAPTTLTDCRSATLGEARAEG